MCRLCSGLGRVREWVGPEPWRTRDVVLLVSRGRAGACPLGTGAASLRHRAQAAHARLRRLRCSPQSRPSTGAHFALAAALAAEQSSTVHASRAALPWLLLYGGPGDGQDAFAGGGVQRLAGWGALPLYTVVRTLLDHVRDGLDSANGREYGARFKAVCKAPILILDDLGAEKRSDWSDELLFKLLDYRYREELPTAVASNLIPADLEPRIASRLQDGALGATLLMSGPDSRLTAHRATNRAARGSSSDGKAQVK